MRSNSSRSCDLGGAPDGVAVDREELEQLCGRAQDALAVAAPLVLARLERGAAADRDEHVLQRRAARVVRVDVAGRDGRHAQVLGEVAEERVPAGVAALEGALELDVEAVRPKASREPRGRVRVADAEPVARTAGEADETRRSTPRASAWSSAGGSGSRLLRPRPRVRSGQEPAEVRVARGRLDEQRHMASAGERHLGAGDRRARRGLRRVRELERAVDTVVVGERERLVAELGRAQRRAPRGARRRRGTSRLNGQWSST